MEKFRIAQYGFIQMVALAYGILSSGALLKAFHTVRGESPIPSFFVRLQLYRDYGLILSIVIIGWAAFCAYRSSGFSDSKMDVDAVIASGLILSAFFFLVGCYLLFGGLAVLTSGSV